MKKPMFRNLKKGTLYACLPLVALLSSSCGDEVEGRAEIDNSAPEHVTDIASQSGPGEVYLSWRIPASSSFMYSKVVYNNARGEEVYQLFSKERADENGIINATISGFVSTDPVKFDIYSCSVRGNSKAPVSCSANPGAPAFLAVAQSISADSAWGGVNINYANETVATVYVVVDYAMKDDASKKGSAIFPVSANSSGSHFIGLNVSDSEFINGEMAVLSISAQDADGNSADPRTVEVRTKKVKAIDRSNWSFPGFADSYDACAGYSSQEAGGEGAYPRGRVTAMIDGDEGTFWHTEWRNYVDYPHFFIIDMAEEHQVVAVTMRRRNDNTHGANTHSGQTFYTCSTADANGSDTNNWNWVNQGWYSFDRYTNAHQLFGMKSPNSARYIKAYFAKEDKAGEYVMVSEFNAYEPAE